VRFFTDQRGTSLVEFALILPILALVLFGLLDFGKALNYWNNNTHLAAEGARWAVVNSNPGSGQTLQQYIQQQVDSSSDPAAPPPVVCVSFPTNPGTGSSGQVGDPVTVTVKRTYNWIPFVASKIARVSTTIPGSATMRLEAPPTNYSAGSGGTGTCT
jgi:Flp pilus assembly protein TadG